MTEINLDTLSVKQLEELKGSINNAIERKKTTELLDVRSQLDALIDNCPFTLEEVLEAKAVKKPVAPKYRNPNDAGQTWTGRGRRPRWVEEYLETEQTLEAVMI